MREIKQVQQDKNYRPENNELEILTYLAHEQEFPLQSETLCSTLGPKVLSCLHHPFPSAEHPSNKRVKVN